MEALDTILAERGQIVIPKAARDALGLRPGARLQIRVEDGRLIVEKKVQLNLDRWIGKGRQDGLDDGLSTDQALQELRGRAVPWVVQTAAPDAASDSKAEQAPQTRVRKRKAAAA